jgi:hypothetical protein
MTDTDAPKPESRDADADAAPELRDPPGAAAADDTPPQAGAEPHVAEDRPARGSRGWRGLVADAGEREAFAGTLALIVLPVGATIIWGLPGLFLSSLIISLLIMVVLIVISMGG